MEFYEKISGARFHSSFLRPCGIAQDIEMSAMDGLDKFVHQCLLRICEIETLLSESRIWKQRLVDVGIISYPLSCSHALSGVLMRGIGVPWDLRLVEPFDAYSIVDFNVPLSSFGDSYSRYLMRAFEMKESLRIVQNCLGWLNTQNFYSDKNSIYLKTSIDDFKLSVPDRFSMETDMESLIHHFKMGTEGILVEKEEVYCSFEAPKGETSVYIVTEEDVSNIP